MSTNYIIKNKNENGIYFYLKIISVRMKVFGNFSTASHGPVKTRILDYYRLSSSKNRTALSRRRRKKIKGKDFDSYSYCLFFPLSSSYFLVNSWSIIQLHLVEACRYSYCNPIYIRGRHAIPRAQMPTGFSITGAPTMNPQLMMSAVRL